ncbi:unnamed protein product [Linum trigynum]|uniref:Glutathione S-transferase n=1 Tax=Linum trigynum TaxID=586398 RepID=A0AAV2D604_9ROSI
MSGEEKVVLHGMWASPYAKRVEIALKLKGIPYEYVEEDLLNGKSEALLKHNPVHQKVPVLVHNGKPVIESCIILEYIDETWKSSGHALFPQEDTYRRARVRFWADFIQRQLLEKFIVTITAVGEAREEAIKELRKNMELLEEGLRVNFFPEGIPQYHFDDQKNVRFLDITMCAFFGLHKAQSEFVRTTEIIDLQRTPLVFSWVESLKEVPVVKEVLPPHDEVVNLLRGFRQNAVGSSPQV